MGDSAKTTHRHMFYSNDDTSDNRTLSWRNPRDIQDDTHRQPTSIPEDIVRIDRDVDHCMYHSSNNI